MICPRCGTAMELALNGGYICKECWGKPERLAPEPPIAAAPPVVGDPLWAALRQLQERVAKIESAVADLKRWAALDRTHPFGDKDCRPHGPRFLGETAEEPSPEEPGETR